MARITLESYLNQIKAIYLDATRKVAEADEKYRKLGEEEARINTSRDYTREGREKRINQIRAQRQELKKEMEDTRIKANKEAADIRGKVDTMFSAYYRPDPAGVDLQAVKLIEMGALTGTELYKMAEGASTAMRRIIAKKLESMNGFEKEARELKAHLDAAHLRAVDALCETGNYCAGGAPLSGTAGAKSFLKRFDELTAGIMQDAPKIAYVSDYQHPGAYTYETY